MTILRRARHELGMMKYRVRRQMWKAMKSRVSELEVNTRQGKFFVSTQDDSIGAQLYTARRFDLEEMTIATNFLRREGLLEAKDSLLLDIGSNIGVICIGMLYKGMVAKTIAIEAEPFNFELLRRNIALNGFESRATCVHCAVSAEDGVAKMKLHQAHNFGDHRVMSVSASGGEARDQEYVEVPARRLDDIVRENNNGRMPGPRQCLTWMDIQGHESFALKGAPELMATGNPLYVELWPWGLEQWGGGTKQFAELVAQHWTEFVRFMPGGEERLPIAELPRIFEQIGYDEFKFSDAMLIRK